MECARTHRLLSFHAGQLVTTPVFSPLTTAQSTARSSADRDMIDMLHVRASDSRESAEFRNAAPPLFRRRGGAGVGEIGQRRALLPARPKLGARVHAPDEHLRV